MTSSVTWKYFEVKDNEKKLASCLTCGAICSFKSSVWNLTLHARRHHGVLVKMPDEDKGVDATAVVDDSIQSISEHKVRMKSSVAWKYFEVKDNEKKLASCLICGALCSFKSSVWNLTQHVRRHHGALVKMPDEDKGVDATAEVDDSIQSISEHKVRKNSSVAWKYFEVKDNEKKLASCLTCGALCTFKSSVWNLTLHVRRHHGVLAKMPDEDNGVDATAEVDYRNMASTSTETESNKVIDNLQYHDMNNKMKMTSNIVKACKLESQVGDYFPYFIEDIERTQTYTKAHQYLIYKCKSKNKQETSFLNYEQQQHQKRKHFPVSFDKFRDVYVDCYVEKRVLPTTQAFMKAIGMIYASGTWANLLSAGFMHVRIPNTKFSTVVEKTDQAQRRMEYLSKVANYRSNGRDFVYIEEKCVHTEMFDGSYYMKESIKGHTWSYICVVVSKSGILHLCYFDEVSCHYKSIIMEMINKTERPTVFVLEEKAHHDKNICALPTPHSTKQEMSAFLTINDVPHDPESSKAELYNLIQKSKRNCKTELYSLDEMVKAYGHTILRRPFGFSKLAFLSKYWESHEKEAEKREKRRTLLSVKAQLTRNLKNYTTDDWENAELELIEREKQMYTEDLQVEEVIDRIMFMAKHEKLLPKDFKQYGVDEKGDPNLDDVLILDNL